jgi:hypothetical protein
VSTQAIIAGFIISTVGFSIFLFGKKQRRPPQLVIGILMMVSPFVVPDPLWDYVTAIALLVILRIAVRSGL